MKKLRTVIIPLILGIVIAGGYGLYWMYYLRGSVYTDDARVAKATPLSLYRKASVRAVLYLDVPVPMLWQ